MKRINTIAKYISKNDRVIDVGCDHAYLSMALSRNKIYSIASDIRRNIIENSYEVAKKKELDKYIDFRVGNGLEVLSESDNINTLVLSGMGSTLMISILKNSNFRFKKIITISNREHEFLRTEMQKLGYKADLEEIIFEKNKYYNLILFVPGKKEYTEEELIIGVNHQNMELFREKNKIELDKINKILTLKQINNEKLYEKKNLLEKYI